MRKALSFTCLVLLICFGGSAWAGKSKIAILGLEAAPGPTGAVDPETTQVARDITKELRQRAGAAASPYVIAPNSNKELNDEKLLMSCDNEAVSCMVVIGAGLAADVLLYGRVERKGDVYRVSLKLLDVKAKTIQPGNDDLPVGGSVTGVSKRLYGKLIADTPGAGGTLIIKARSQTGAEISRGTVMIDEERKGDLAGGRLTLSGISEGRHTLAIEASGYRRFEETVTVHAGEQVSLDTVLFEKESSTSSGHSSLWKVSLGASLVVAAAGGGLAYYADTRQQYYSGTRLKFVPNPANAEKTVGVTDCNKNTSAGLAQIKTDRQIEFDNGAFGSACKWHKANIAGFVILGIGGAGALFSVIMMSRDPGPSEKPPTGARSKKPDVALVPVLTPEVAGASFSLTW